ncbi:MAG: DUF134 domain-containing protein [Sulfolobales archaeon]
MVPHGHRWGWRYRRFYEEVDRGCCEEIIYIPVKEIRGVSIEDVIEIFDYEIDLLKMIYLDGLTLEDAAAKIGVSKATTWRIIENARVKIIRALHEKKPMKLVSSSREASIEAKENA